MTRRALPALALSSLVAALLVPLAGPARADDPATVLQTRTFTSQGAEQTWKVPAGVTSVIVHAVGGRGGNGSGGWTGGRAATLDGSLDVTPGTTYYVGVGSDGASNGTGGWNGGGAGGASDTPGAGGGGATDLRTCSRTGTTCNSLDSRLIVAAGAGGGGASDVGSPYGGDAGQAGGTASYTQATNTGGQPGTDSAGGAGGTSSDDVGERFFGGTAGDAGSLGQGGNGAMGVTAPRAGSQHIRGAGGGGGGLYGGGGGADISFYGAGGGGGSSLVPDGWDSGLEGTGATPAMTFTYSVPGPTDVAVATDLDSTKLPYDHGTTVTATVTNDDGTPINGQDVSITTDGDQSVDPVQDNGDGTYSAYVLADETPGDVTITVTVDDDPALTQTLVLTQVPEISNVAVSLSPTSIPASGKATTTVTIALTRYEGVADDYEVVLDSDDPGALFTDGSDTGSTFNVFTDATGTATVDLQGTTTVGTSHVTATVVGVSPNTSGHATLTQVTPTKPTITASAVPSGWSRQPVTVSFTCTRGTSALEHRGCPTPHTFGEGRNQSFTATVADVDGATGSTTVSGVNVDLTAPAVSVPGVSTKPYKKKKAPKLTCVGADSLSGLASCTVTQTKVKKKKFFLWTYAATATDVAGNTRTVTGSYRVKR